MSLLIKNVRIIDYKTDMCCDLYIEKDQIKDIGNLSYKADTGYYNDWNFRLLSNLTANKKTVKLWQVDIKKY